jgi:hypothetical protein
MPSKKAAIMKVTQNGARMMQHTKRICDRFDCCFSVCVARFNSTQYFPGKMANYSSNGLYFESESALLPGTSILIRVQNNLDVDRAFEFKEGFRSISLGEVKWCQEFISEGSTCYAVGVKYYAPDY